MINAKLIRVMTGEEVVAELVSETEDSITIRNGLVVIPQPQNVGFAPWATVISKEDPEITVSKSHVIYIAELDQSVKNKYNELFGSKLVTPDEKKLII
jgi:hypothetical protein